MAELVNDLHQVAKFFRGHEDAFCYLVEIGQEQSK